MQWTCYIVCIRVFLSRTGSRFSPLHPHKPVLWAFLGSPPHAKLVPDTQTCPPGEQTMKKRFLYLVGWRISRNRSDGVTGALGTINHSTRHQPLGKHSPTSPTMPSPGCIRTDRKQFIYKNNFSSSVPNLQCSTAMLMTTNCTSQLNLSPWPLPTTAGTLESSYESTSPLTSTSKTPPKQPSFNWRTFPVSAPHSLSLPLKPWSSSRAALTTAEGTASKLHTSPLFSEIYTCLPSHNALTSKSSYSPVKPYITTPSPHCPPPPLYLILLPLSANANLLTITKAHHKTWWVHSNSPLELGPI